jgi:hypothetical protein
MTGFAWWVAGVGACVLTLTQSDLLLFEMVAYFFLLVTCGGLIGYVHGYCERDLEAREDVLMRESSIGKN